jgi:nucleotide-binding universal stress UspA family protein
MPLVRSTPSELLLFRGVARAEEGKDARTYLVRLSEALNGQNVRSAISVETGEPGPAILARLQSGAFDVGALTTHGRTGMTRVLLGSVAEFVVRSARVPLILNRPDARIGEWRRIIVPLDGSPAAEAVLGDLERIAPGTGATLHLMNVAEAALAAPGVKYSYAEVTAPDLKPYLREVADRLRAKGLNVETETRTGSPAADIVGRAVESGAGLIAMTTHGRTGLSRVIMGSVAEQIIRTAPCPVLIRRSLG